MSGAFNGSLFLDPMLGSNLTFFIEKEVQEKDSLTDIIQVCSSEQICYDMRVQHAHSRVCPKKCGGNVSAGYSGVTYILGERVIVYIYHRA